MILLLLGLFFICCNLCKAYPFPEQSRLNVHRQKQFRRTFHVETSQSVQIEGSSSDARLKLCPDYEKGLYNVEIFSTEILENTRCKLVYDSNVGEEHVEVDSDSNEYICKWSDLHLKPGQWYHFKTWITPSNGLAKRLSNSWEAVEPAFDVDKFGITVVSKETGLEVNLDSAKTSKMWNTLIGETGLLIVTLIDGEKKITKTVAGEATKLESPMVAFNGLTPHKCYTIEVYTSMDNIASYNRTWFDVKTGSGSGIGSLSLSVDEVTINTAKVSVKSSKLGKSCKVILTIKDHLTTSEDQPRYQYLENQSTITVVDLLPIHKYVISAATNCDAGNNVSNNDDACEVSGSGNAEISFETLPYERKL